MDMKTYILIAGGSLIGLVVLHALWSVWRANRKLPDADEAEVAAALAETADGDQDAMWGVDALTEELTGPPSHADAFSAEAEVEPVVDVDGSTGADVDSSPSAALEPTVTEPLAAAAKAWADDDAPAAPIADDAEKKGRRIEVRGKRTEPTVPRELRPEFREFAAPEPEPEPAPAPAADEPVDTHDLVVFWLLAKSDEVMDGEALFDVLRRKGLKYGTDRVFKKTDPRCGGDWYTVANGVEPGTFDVSAPAALGTPRVVMLMRLSGVRDPLAAFDDMLDVAQDIANNTGSELMDENRSTMTQQTIEHYRQRIRDFRRMVFRT